MLKSKFKFKSLIKDIHVRQNNNEIQKIYSRRKLKAIFFHELNKSRFRIEKKKSGGNKMNEF